MRYAKLKIDSTYLKTVGKNLRISEWLEEGARLVRNEANDLNQLVETEGASYTFDLNGNLDTKTVGGKTWTYQNNSLNQIISIKCPDKATIKFTYDPIGKRLTKRIVLDKT